MQKSKDNDALKQVLLDIHAAIRELEEDPRIQVPQSLRKAAQVLNHALHEDLPRTRPPGQS